MVLSLPLPYLSAVLQALLAALLMQRRGDARTIGFIALSACMALLVGLRWSFPHPYLWFAVALISSVQAPLAWLCFDRPSGGATGATLPAHVSARAPFSTWCISRWLPWLAAALTAALLWAGPAYWNGVELLLVVLYMGYGGALLGLGWGQHAWFDAFRLSQVPDLRRAAIWAGWALLFNGVLEGADRPGLLAARGPPRACAGGRGAWLVVALAAVWRVVCGAGVCAKRCGACSFFNFTNSPSALGCSAR